MRNGEYELVVAPDDYPGKRYRERYCYEHRLVWWRETGELPRGLIIHHKNGNKRDNRFCNLEASTVAVHNGLHAQGRKMIALTCAFCGSIFEKEARNIVPKQRQGQTDFYCDRKCMGKAFGRGRPKK